MADQDNLQLQGLKTIRQMQESMQQDAQEEQKALHLHIQETQKILDGSADREAKQHATQMQHIPNLAHAKTIKESMADWIDDDAPKNMTTNKQQTQLNQPAQNIKQQDSMQITQKTESTQHAKQDIAQTTKQSQTTTAQEIVTNTPLDSDGIELKQDRYQQIVKANANTKQETWLLLDEFLKLSGLEREKVVELIKDKTIKSKQENGRIYVEASTGTSALIKKVENRLVSLDMSGNALDPVFVEKTIATILGLHDKVLSSKDETIAAFKSENSFLKEALVSMQEIYDDDKKTIEILRQQLQKTQEEVEFVKRKYKLMWGKVSNSTT